MNILAFPRGALSAQLAGQTVPFVQAPEVSGSVFRPRAELENDPAFLQLIPYAVLQHPDGQVWAYQRTGGDGRVKGRKSVGVGGHVDEADQHSSDLLETAHCALRRELQEELINPPEQIPASPLGWINEQVSEIGSVHIGLVWSIPWLPTEAPEPRAGEALAAIGFVDPTTVTEANGFELWSQLACQLISST